MARLIAEQWPDWAGPLGCVFGLAVFWCGVKGYELMRKIWTSLEKERHGKTIRG